VSLKELNIVNGECNVMKYYSIGMKLNDVIKDKDTEQVILENIRRCSNIVGKLFKVVFWHVNLTEQECKDFVKRNEHLLFEVNTQITKRAVPVWFLIGDGKDGRYRFDGNILQGISQYLKIINHIKKRDGE
jgi:thioredoxin reductase